MRGLPAGSNSRFLRGFEPALVQAPVRWLCGRGPRAFRRRRSSVALDDPGTLLDPLVACVHALREVVVGDDLLRYEHSCADDLRSHCSFPGTPLCVDRRVHRVVADRMSRRIEDPRVSLPRAPAARADRDFRGRRPPFLDVAAAIASPHTLGQTVDIWLKNQKLGRCRPRPILSRTS